MVATSLRFSVVAILLLSPPVVVVATLCRVVAPRAVEALVEEAPSEQSLSRQAEEQN